MAGDERLRLFCALRLDEATLDELERWQAAHLGGGRIVARENLHVTLAFLGSRPVADVPAVVRELRGAAQAAKRPTLAVRRYLETPRVGMLLLEDARPGESHAVSLAYDVQRRMEQLGIELRERRPWKPHITVLRFRERPGLQPLLPGLGRFDPSDAAAYNSVLRSAGAQYEILETVALGGR